ncbi:hypothetical protein AX16_010744 [Volvariella volvacea WC 439]|nr:hypothetical protein AX16_010744 [Volvariella volvacea WC 439]
MPSISYPPRTLLQEVHDQMANDLSGSPPIDDTTQPQRDISHPCVHEGDSRNLLIPENRPGLRPLEKYKDRVKYVLAHPPKSANNAYHKYALARRAQLDELVAGHTSKDVMPELRHIDTTPIIIFSDGSKRNTEQYASGAAYTAYAQNARIVSGKRFAGRCTNFEAEIYGMGLGVLDILANMLNVRIWGDDPVWAEIRHPDHIVIAADNESAMKCLLDPSTHAAQSLSIPVIRGISAWISADEKRTITFIHCPAHKGIELNEKVNKDAKAASLIKPHSPPPVRSIAWERAHVDRKALDIWKSGDPSKWGQSSHFLREHSNWKNQGGTHLKSHGEDVKKYAQFVRSVTGHAPIGQFRAKFFPEEPRHCPECRTFQDRYHVMFECDSRVPTPALTPTRRKMKYINRIEDRNIKFVKHIELSPLKPGRQKTPSIMASYFEWLELNPKAFTFQGAPLTVPR